MAVGTTTVTIMDDKSIRTPAWLAFALSQPNAVSLCRHLRESCPDPGDAGHLIQRYFTEQDTALEHHLAGKVDNSDLARMRSASTLRKVQDALKWQEADAHHHLLGLDHPAYPTLLKDTADAPVLLYAEGSLAALERPLIAAVGSRKASPSALKHTHTVCAELAAQGIGIVSGLARGIDAAAHRAALSVNGVTIAIAATAPGKIYPRQHAALAASVLEHDGLILTEYGLGSATKPWFFPQRNRIISGMSLGVLVAEASLPSGTLTTATHAMNQGREVMAVPGSVHNLQARGCHALIKQGAALVEETADIIDALGEPLQRALRVSRRGDPGGSEITSQTALPLEDPTLDPRDQQLLTWLSQKPASIDELMTLAGADEQARTVSQLSASLGLLEIRGFITTTAGGRYARC